MLTGDEKRWSELDNIEYLFVVLIGVDEVKLRFFGGLVFLAFFHLFVDGICSVRSSKQFILFEV